MLRREWKREVGGAEGGIDARKVLRGCSATDSIERQICDELFSLHGRHSLRINVILLTEGEELSQVAAVDGVGSWSEAM